MAGGGTSPRGSALAGGTLLLKFGKIELDNVTLSQNSAGLFALRIANSGSGTDAGTIGGTGATVELRGVLHSLQACLPQTLLKLAGPGDDARPLAPLLSGPIAAGTKLPSPIEGRNPDIDVYAPRVNTAAGQTSLSLPTGSVTVGTS
ncbi:MAG TPA: hypothetical protein VHU88_04755 [Sporichthyaceae bacterium]|nr:hypothetical protein [Sporichthyaceae bacterium]